MSSRTHVGEVGAAPRGEVVEHPDPVPVGQQPVDEVGPDESAATGHENVHRGALRRLTRSEYRGGVAGSAAFA